MDIQTVSIVVAAIGVFIAAVNSIISSRRAEEHRQLTLETQQHALETRQAQLFMQIYNRWTSRDMIRSYGLIRYKYTDWENLEELWGQANPAVDPDQYPDHMTLHAFYEGIGVLVKRGLIDVSMVEDLFSQRIMWHWERYGPGFKEARITTGDPTQYDHIEYLYNLMKQREQQPTAVSP